MASALKNKPSDPRLGAALRRAGFKRGEALKFKVSRRKVTIVATVDDDTVLTPEEAKKVRHGMKQIRQGKAIPWSQVKNELGL